MHIAAVREIDDRLLPALRTLRARARRTRRANSPASSRSAGPICRTRRRSAWAQEFGAYAAPGRARHRARRGVPAAALRPWRKAAPRSAPASTRPRDLPIASPSSSAASPDCRSSRPRQVRGAGRERRARRAVGRAQRDRRITDEDRERHPPHGFGSALRHRRTAPARERARLLDHARQGQSDPGRGCDDGGGAGHGQPRHHHDRRQPGPFRAERDEARHHRQRAAIAAPPRRRVQQASPTTASAGSRPTARASPSSSGARSCW